MESKSYSYRYNAWFGSIVSQAKLLSGQAGLLPELYYDFLYRDGRRTAIAMAGGGSSFNDAAQCVKALGRARLVPAYDAVSGGYAISFDGGKFSVDAAEYDEDGFVHFLETLGREYVLTESFADPADGTVNVVILSRSEPEGMVTTPVEAFITRTGGCTPLASDEHSELIAKAKSTAAYLAFFELLQFKFVPCGEGHKLIDVSTKLTLPEGYAPSEALAQFIADWDEKSAHPDPEHAEIERREREFSEKWAKIADTEHRSGMRPYMASLWDAELRADMADGSITDAERKWAHERGFFGYRIRELGLTEDNYRRYVPDYDYFWVNRINPEYQMWISDKLASRFALAEFKSVLPEHYYAVARINGASRILPLPELPEGYKLSYASLFALLEEKRLLAVKRTYGSHGQGFNKLECRDGRYILNGVPMSADAIVAELFSAEGVYLVTEYVLMHEWFKSFYPEALNTVRVNCFHRTGELPQIGACFMKLGHSKGGFTDNINTAEGGIIISLDKETGRIIEPEFKSGDHYTPCPVHPDTGVAIEGNVPHWDMILDGVRDVCRSMPQLQYFGFDVAVTPTGYKIIEVNVFPDYTKYLLRDEKTQEFLTEKVRQKFYRYRIDLPELYRMDGKAPSKGFKFTVVAPDEPTARQFARQTMGFKENVQLIVTGECGALREHYPKNVAQANDRSEALQMAEGRYILFADSGDAWPQSTLAKVWDFFEANGDKTDVVACRQRWTGGKTGWIKLDYKFATGSGVVDITERPDCIQTSLCSAFLRTEKAKEHGFDAALPMLGGSLLINSLVLQKGTIGLLREPVCTRIFVDAPEHEANAAALPERYCAALFALSERLHGRVGRYAQYLAVDELRTLTVSDNAALCGMVRELLRKCDAHVLATARNCALGTKAALLRLRDGSVTVRLDGEEAFAGDEALGKLNAAGALTVDGIETGSRYHITGHVLLPGFVTKPVIYLADAETGKKLADVPLTPAPEAKYRCLDGGYSYVRYEFAVAVREAHLAALTRFGLKTDTAPVKLSINLKKDSPLAALRRSGDLCVPKRTLLEKLKGK